MTARPPTHRQRISPAALFAVVAITVASSGEIGRAHV